MYKANLAFELEAIKKDLEDEIKAIDERIPKYRKGSLFKQGNYYYIKYYEDGKTISIYIGKGLSDIDIVNIQRELKNHKTLEKRKIDRQKELNEINKLIRRYKRVK